MEEMSGLDARFLHTETASAHMHTIKVAVVDVAARPELLTPEMFLGLLEERLDRMPVLRRRVVMVPHGLGAPLIVDDPDFALERSPTSSLTWPPRRCHGTAPCGSSPSWRAWSTSAWRSWPSSTTRSLTGWRRWPC